MKVSRYPFPRIISLTEQRNVRQICHNGPFVSARNLVALSLSQISLARFDRLPLSSIPNILDGDTARERQVTSRYFVDVISYRVVKFAVFSKMDRLRRLGIACLTVNFVALPDFIDGNTAGERNQLVYPISSTLLPAAASDLIMFDALS